MVSSVHQQPALDKATLLHLFRQMVVIREFEEQVSDLYTRTLIPGLAHLSIGQEAVPTGVCSALRTDDYITSTHRGHGHCLAKGARPDRMFAEMFGKIDGYCRGKGGSMHIADPATGNLGANAIVGGSVAIAAGAALSAKRRKTGQVVVCFFGDGALNQGLLAESMNMASIWQLPVLYVCESNRYGEYTAMEQVTAGNVQQRGEALGIPSSTIDGMSVLDVYAATLEAVERARAGSGPSFLICQTYRYFGHGMSDQLRGYRTRDEENIWRERDPIAQFTRYLLENAQASQSELDTIIKEVKQAMLADIEFGKQSAFPTLDEVTQHVYAS